jgi:uncharacterized phage infection (PIP) family protein YhgE
MTGHAHFYLNWAKERIDEMDAVLATLEGKVSQLTADARAAADKAVTDLRAKRETFFSEMKKQSEAGEAAWAQAKQQLETQWSGFQAEANTYFEKAAQQAKQQQAAFEEIAAAQVKAWREAAEKFQVSSAEFAADRRAKMEATAQDMKAGAAAAEAKLQELSKAGAASWNAWSTALTESRAAFDRANQAAWEQFKHASRQQ